MTETVNSSHENRLTWFIDQCAQAVASVWSQTLGSEWKLEDVVDSASSEGETLVFATAGVVSGQVVFVFPMEQATLLACRSMGEPNADQPYHAKHRESLEELFRQVMIQITPQMHSLAGEVRFDLLPAEQAPAAEGSSWELRLASGDERITLAVRLDQSFISSLEACSRAWQAPLESIPAAVGERPVLPENLNLLLDVELPASLRFGQKQLKLKDVLQLSVGSVIELDQQVQEPVELLVDGRVIARGDVVIVDGNYGLRVTEVASTGERARVLP